MRAPEVMKTLLSWVMAGTVLASPAAVQPADAAEPSLGKRFVAGRLSVGGRFNYYRLEDSRRAGEDGYDNGNLAGNFLGTLWGLDAQQHYFPNPYLEYRLVSGLGVGVTYDELRAKTLDWANDEHTSIAGDGDLDLRGAGVYAWGRLRNRSRFEPYASVGYAWYATHFEVAPGWAAPGRRFEVEDTEGWFASVGCAARLGPHLGIDVQFRHARLDDVAARAYIGAGNHHRSGAFPVRHDAIAAGVLYGF
jgi:hypothetical protein